MNKKQRKTIALLSVSVVLLVVAYFLPLAGPWKGIPFAIPYLLLGIPVWKRGVFSVFRGQMMDENFLMAVASVGAFLLGEYGEGVAVILFYRVGELFESYAVDKSRDSVSRLMNLCPEEATVLREGAWQTVFPEEIAVGELIRVLPGEKIPLDGTITEGASSLDTRSLTGESLPKDVTVGDLVFSGCVNLTGVLVLRAEKEFGESTASKILALVEDASAHRSRSESFVSSFARWYTPLVIVMGLVVGVGVPIFFGNWEVWVYRALEFLVVSCPCALVISVPLTYFGAIGGASRKGILIKGSDRMEALAKAHTVVFDKTGTLTRGVFEVCGIEGEHPETILQIAAHCEQFSNHPIARSLRDAWGKELSEERISSFQETAGFGVSAKLDGIQYYVGNHRWMENLGYASKSIQTPGTHIYVANDRECLGVITIADRLKDRAAESVSALRSMGIRRIFMLTGDQTSSAEAIARQGGMDGFLANLLPHQKVSALQSLTKSSGESLVFVGDGMNDAPVLAAADVGVAMGGIGADAAIEAADVVLMHDDLSALPKALALARKTHRIVWQNVIFSIAVKVLVLILCTLGIATMWHAVFADVGVSVIAILNAMRTLSNREQTGLIRN